MEKYWVIILVLLPVIYLLVNTIDKLSKPNKFKNSLTVEDLTIPKKKFVELVLMWCQQNLGQHKHGINLKIYYYFNKKWGGLYFYRNRLITLYIPRWLKLTDLTLNVIHEYVHYLQIVNPSDDAMYIKHTQEVGYWMNPYEVEAREVAQKHQGKCLEWVMKNLN